MLNKAEAAVKVGTDAEGNIIYGAPDFGPIAPLLNQAHRNVEILARLTGELATDKGGGDVNIQIVMPGAVPAGIEPPTIEIDVIKR